MNYNIVSPSKELESVIKQYIVITSLDGIDDLLFLPNGCNFIIFNRGINGYAQVYNSNEKFQIPKKYSISAKTNQIKKFVLHDKPNKIEFPIIFAELTPIGFYKLFNLDASLLKDSYLELDSDIVKKYFQELYNFSTIEDEISYLNSNLKSLYDSQNNKHMPIEDVIDKIINSYQLEVTIDMLVKEFDCSRSTMERNFKKIVGLTPKNFIFVTKFCKTVLEYIEKGCKFSELTYLYSDSSHLNSVFKKFFGLNPSTIIENIENDKMKIYQITKLKK